MQIISEDLTNACSAPVQEPCYAVEISWTKTGLITAAKGGTGWTDESAYLERTGGQLSISPPGDQLVAAGSVGTATVLLSNTTQRFSWMRSDKPLYSYIGGPAGLAGIPIRIYTGYVTENGPEYVRIFTGVISGWSERAASVELMCKDWGFRFLQDKRSTAVSSNKLPDEWIALIAEAAGISETGRNLGKGIFPIPWCWMDDESVVDEIWEAAAADGGLAWFNQNGVLIYQNCLAWVSQPISWVFSEGTYVQAEPRMDVDPVATSIKVEWSGRYEGPNTEIYNLSTVKTILPGQTVVWTARFDNAVSEISSPISDDPFNDFYAVSGGGLDVTGEITVELSDQYAQQCTVAVTNNSDIQAARLVSFKLRGSPLVGGPSEQAEALVSVAPFNYQRVRSERGNPYCQTLEQGSALAQLLALRGRRVRPIYPLQDVPGLPHLELGDQVTFIDSRSLGSGQSVNGLVIGISWEAGSSGYKQSFSLMDITDLAAYGNYFIIGTSKLGGPFSELDPESTYGRLFY